MNFKTLKKLTQKKHRLEMGLCIIEGEKLVREHEPNAVAVFKRGENLTEKQFDEISILDTPQSVLAVVPIPKPGPHTNPYLVLDNIGDPGNMGTILRTAAAFGFNTVYCINCADPFSQKVLRAASGTQFSLNIIQTTLEDFTPHGTLFIADSRGGVGGNAPCSRDSGLVLGSEGRGISPELKKHPHKIVTIPLKSGVESLNVSVAGGILMYLCRDIQSGHK